MQVKKGTLLIAGLLLLGAVDASAQMEWAGRGFVNINGSFQVGDKSFTDTLTEQLYDETATYDLTNEFSGGALFDVSGGVWVWRNLAAGLGVSNFSTTSTITLAGTVPHPLFFNRPRAVTHQQGGLDHRQLGWHFQLTWLVPVTDKLDVAFFGGPSVFNVRQRVATQMEIVETGMPFDTATVNRVVTQESSQNGFGRNVGVDFTYLFTDALGGGIMLRWAGASVDFPSSGGTQSVDAGGFQMGFGARLRF
jgi:hypothetical protein